MEIEQPNYQLSLFKGIVNRCDPHLQMSFLQFLQTQIILNIALVAKKYKKQEYFYKLALVMVYYKSYLTRVDRSMYYLFYEEKQFTTLEQTFIINIAKKTDNAFFQLRNSYQQLIDKFQQNSQCVTDQDELKNILQTMLFETDYPLPACKRQTIGVYCQTPYQQFMSLIRFPSIQPPQQFIQPPLQQMRKYFLQENDMSKTVQNLQQNGAQNISKLSVLRYCPYQIRNRKIQQFQIQNFQLHNLIVYLFKIVAINAKSSNIIINEQKDPIMKIAEFVTRANIYKNIILAVQQKFNFLFQSYGDIFQIFTKGQHSANLPKFQFWNGAMTIWVEQFKDIQEELYQSFNYIVLRQREANTSQFLQQKAEEFPSVYNSLKLEFDKKSLFGSVRDQKYKDIGVCYQEFFEQNVDSFDILGKDFLQHQVDSSINQINVHKCGHSEHAIKRIPFFKSFIQRMKESTNQFYSHLQKLIFKKTSDKKLRISLLKDLIKSDMDFLDAKFTKPVILKEILLQAKLMIDSLVQKIPQFAVFTQQTAQKFGLHIDFSHKDNLLDYFCAKSQTPNDCIIKLRSFYDTYKEKSVQQLLQIALSTKQESQCIQSEIQEEFYESSQSNNSIVSIDQE